MFLLASQLLLGIGAGIISTPIMAIVASSIAPQNRLKAITILSVSQTTCRCNRNCNRRYRCSLGYVNMYVIFLALAVIATVASFGLKEKQIQ
jgi:hypothetical protein